MERCVAVSTHALNTGALSAPADVAGQLPARSGDLVNRVDRLEEDGVTEVNLWYPQCAQHVHPTVTLRLLERSCNTQL